MIDKWKKAVDNNIFGALLTDLLKAFDGICHNLLVAKLLLSAWQTSSSAYVLIFRARAFLFPPSVFCFVLKVHVKKPTHCALFCKKPTYCQLLTSFRISNRMLVLFCWMCCLILFYRMNLMCFADYLNSLLLIFCFFRFILSLLIHFVPTYINVQKNEFDSKICF